MATTQWFVFLPAIAVLGLTTLPAAEAAPIDSIPEGVFVPEGTTTPPPTIPRIPVGPENTFVPTVGVIDHDQFPVTGVGNSSTANFVITNPDSNMLVDVLLEAPGEFTVIHDGCTGRPLGQGATCTVTIEFTPTDAGVFNGNLNVKFDAQPIETVTFMASTTTGVTSTSQPPPTDSPTTITTAPPDTEPPITTPPVETSTPPSSAVPTTTPDDATPDERLEQCNARALDALVSFAPAQTMTVGHETAVTVSVAVDDADLPPVLTDGSTPPTTIVPAELSCFLNAELSGTNFEIDTPRQSGDFFRSNVLTWTWRVTPVNTSANTLTLRITPQIDIGGSARDGTPRPFTSRIKVTPVPQSWWDDVADLFEAFVGHPIIKSVPVLATVIAVLVAFWKWILKRPWPRPRKWPWGWPWAKRNHRGDGDEAAGSDGSADLDDEP